MIFFFDIDGTLMPFGKDVPASTIEAIHSLRRDGHKAFIATGRSPAEVSDRIRSIGFDGAVYSSGAAVEIDGKTIYRRIWSRKEYDKAVPYLLGRGFPVILQADNGTYLTQETQDIWYSLLMKHVGRIVQVPSLRIVDELPDDEEVNKLLGEKLYAYIKENNLNVLGEPLPTEGRQQDIDFDTMDSFEFVFDLALAPEFEVAVSGDDTIDYYNITVDDKMIDGQVKMYAQRAGGYDKVDVYESNDMVKGLLAELDENGNTKEGGIQVENAIMMPEYFKNDEQKAIFNGKG